MRKIERLMSLAITQRKNWKCGNTQVSYRPDARGDVLCVTLHGHEIARIDYVARKLSVTLAGYPTVTTRSRVNAVLRHFAIYSGYTQRGFGQYFKGHPTGPYTVHHLPI